MKSLLLAGILLPLAVWAAEKDLQLPPLVSGAPGPGKRVSVTAPEYAGTGVHHLLYLPPDWKSDWKASGRRWPVIVEYTGNKAPKLGSSGEVEGAGLGYGLSGGRFIWVVLPYINEDGEQNQSTWWGDEKATVAYAKRHVPQICAEYGGEASAVFLCGFSRGAIGVNYLGLHDDAVARLWCGLISHDHYDGVREWRGTPWGSPLDIYRREATERLARLRGRPVLVCQNGGTREIEHYLQGRVPLDNFTFLNVRVREIFPVIPNALFINAHTDRWLLRPSADRQTAWNWVANVLTGQSSKADRAALFKRWDQNQDGNLGWEEYAEGGGSALNPRHRFQFFDRNHNGTVSREEFLNPQGTKP